MLMFFGLIAAEILTFPEQPDIYLEIHGAMEPANKVYYLAPHQPEHVINRYLARKVKKRGEKFLVLRQNGDRHIFLKLDENTVEVDPNRIFTPRGCESTLRRQNPRLESKPDLLAKAKVKAVRLGEFIMEHMGGISKGSVIVAIHNNTDGYDGDGKNGVGTVSIDRYQKRMDSGAKYIKAVHAGSHDEDDLFFITDQDDFDLLSNQGFNVILQHPQVADLEDEDDGSLSVLSEMRGVRYLNVEAQRDPDHRRRQKKMIKALFKLLDQE